jgi:chromate transporter
MTAFHVLTADEWLGLFGQFLLMSLLSVGGAIATAPDMHRYIVNEHGWLTDAQFTSSVALGQATPGPNLLFVAVLGWNIAGALGAAVAMIGILLPSTTLALAVTRWGSQRREHRLVRAFHAGMAPLTLGLLLSTGWVLTEPSRTNAGAIALVVVTVAVIWRTRLSPIWMVALGAIVGAFGWA